jgi:hypothetical protein
MRRLFCIVTVTAATMLLPSVSAARAATTPTDAQLAQAALFMMNDFPPGWTQTFAQPSSSPDLSLAGFGEPCAILQRKKDAARSLQMAHEESPDFSFGSFARISDKVSVYRTAEDANTGLNVWRSSAVNQCVPKALADQLKKTAPSGVEITSSLARRSWPKVGDRSLGFEIAVAATQRAVAYRYWYDIQYVRVGRTQLTFLFGADTRQSLLRNQALVRRVVSRVRAAGRTTSQA